MGMGNTVLVIGESIQSFLTVIRSLGRKGIEVHTASNSFEHPSLYSRYIKKRHFLGSYATGGQKWLARLIRILNHTRYDLVIPCHDSSIVPLQAHKALLDKYAKFALLDTDCFEVISCKHKTWEMAKKVDVRVPSQISVKSLEEVNALGPQYKFPLVLKPVSSVTIHNLDSRHVVKKVYSKEQLQKQISLMLKSGPVLIQKNFSGVGTGVEFLACQGRILTAFQHIRLHEKIGGGPSCYRQSISLLPALFTATKNLVSQLDYTGVGMAEFKYNTETKQWRFLEINGRFWGSLPLAVAAGADFPYYLFELMVHKKTDFKDKTYRNGLRCRNLVLDGAWFFEALKKRHFGTGFNRLPLRLVTKGIYNIIRGPERTDSIVLDDPVPGIRQMTGLCRDAICGNPVSVPWT